MTVSRHRDSEKEKMPELVVELARSAQDVRDSQQLRFQVFGEEMGALLASAAEGLDRDDYDPFCQHLLVRIKDTGEVVGSTRILTQSDARLAGSFYSENEFDLEKLLPLPGNCIEIGRTCIHPGFRNGITIHTLWMGLAAFMESHRVDYLFGCASIGLEDGGVSAGHILQQISGKYAAPSRFKVTPRHRFGGLFAANDVADRVKLPPLLNAYLRLGAWVAGDACVDEDFNCVDVFILLDVENLSSRYRRHFVDRQPLRGTRADVQGGVGFGLVAAPNLG